MDDEKTKQLKRQVWALQVARFSFVDAQRAAEFLLAEKFDEQHDCYPAFMAGIVITYTKAFTDSKTLPKLGRAFEKFDDGKLHKLHDALIQARNSIHAHTDARSSIKLWLEVARTVEGDKERITYELPLHRRDFIKVILPDVVKLCKCQGLRANDKLNQLLEILYPFRVAQKVLNAERASSTRIQIFLPK